MSSMPSLTELERLGRVIQMPDAELLAERAQVATRGLTRTVGAEFHSHSGVLEQLSRSPSCSQLQGSGVVQ